MFIVDRALEEREASGRPIRVGLLGSGFMGRGIADKILTHPAGLRLAGVFNRSIDSAFEAYRQCGVEPVRVSSDGELAAALAAGRPVVTDDPLALCRAEGIDVVIEVTGDVEYAATATLAAIDNGTHMVLMNAEVDATVGPILAVHAARAGVVVAMAEGDEPGAHLNLFRQITGMGLRPVFHGNLKGLQDPYRNPTTQQEFAERTGQRAHMVTSFADGSKMSFELTSVANATGLTIQQRGLVGYEWKDKHVDELAKTLDAEALVALGGVVDYALGAAPYKGVFCFAVNENPRQTHYLRYLKMGDGPLYSFYTPFHLCHLEVPTSVARVAIFGDAPGVPLGRPQLEVVATAKRDLTAGETLDGIGWYMTYGQCERYDDARAANLLPMGVAEGCILLRDVAKDAVLTYDDVRLPEGRVIDRLRAEQDAHFGIAATTEVTAR